MNASYIGVGMEKLPNTAIVFDRFHVVKLMNEKIPQIHIISSSGNSRRRLREKWSKAHGGFF